jgi:4-hydroxybenzoyl-CoA thioesterase
MFSHTHHLTVEWGDCDPAGIVFYPRFFAMFDAATAFLLEAASGRTRAGLISHYEILGWPMVDTKAVFHSPVSFDDKITIRSEVLRIGRSSFDVEHELIRGSTRCVTASETRVWARKSSNGILSDPLPDELRAALSGGQ